MAVAAPHSDSDTHRTAVDRLVLLLATGLGTGRSPWAPGTAGSVLGLGCKEEGPMERAGATIDEKLDAVADPFDGREGAFEKLGEKVDDASDSMREKIDDAMDR